MTNLVFNLKDLNQIIKSLYFSLPFFCEKLVTLQIKKSLSFIAKIPLESQYLNLIQIMHK